MACSCLAEDYASMLPPAILSFRGGCFLSTNCHSRASFTFASYFAKQNVAGAGIHYKMFPKK
jgi:hypothetical protein